MGHTHRYKFGLRKKKIKTSKESQYLVSHPELGSDPPIGSDRESGCDTIHPTAPVLLLFHAFVVFVTISCFFPFYPCNSFWFCFLLVISYTLSTYISLSLYKLSITSLNFGNTESGRQFPRCFLFSHFFSFSFPFLGCQTFL